MKYNINFAVKCKSSGSAVDIGTSNILRYRRFFPNDTTKVYVSAGDLLKLFGVSCNSNIVNGQVKIIISGPTKYNTPLSGALIPTVIGDTLVYTIPDFSLVNSLKDFAFSVITNTTAQIGDPVCFEVFVTPTAGDNNVSNNHLTHCFAVSNSFDPNEKEVSPVGSVPYPFNDWLTYTVHFQNTGNDSARHIQILDTLDANIDARSFEQLNYSVMPLVQIKGSNVAFNLVNIMLPDSATNPEGSKGYVTYRVKPKENLPAGTSVKNKANIYFDFNAPIVTNETENIITLVTSEKSKFTSEKINVEVYPNPVSELLVVRTSLPVKEVLVTDLVGRVIDKKIGNNMTKNLNIETKKYPSGIYFIQIKFEGGLYTEKFVKE